MSATLLNGVSDADLESALLDAPVSSLYDIAYTYGQLYALATEERVDADVNSEHIRAMTPDEQSQLYDQDNSLLSVRIDLSNGTPALDDNIVDIERLSREKAIKVGYAYPYRKRGAMIAHSIAHYANSKDEETTAKYARHRLTRWPTDEAVQQVAESDDQGIVNALAQLGSDDAVTETVTEAVERAVSDLGGTFDGLVSLKIKSPKGNQFLYPGQIPILNEAMVGKKRDRFESYSEAEDSVGAGTDFVTGDEEVPVLGITPGSPGDYIHAKQVEKFPGLDPNRGWQSRPMTVDTAMAVAAGGTVIDACSTYFGGGVEVTYLPYLAGTMDSDDARWLYRLLDDVLEGETITDVLQDRFYERSRRSNRLRAFVFATATDLDRKDKLIHESSEMEVYVPGDLAEAHVRALDAWPFSADDPRQVFSISDSDDAQLSRENSALFRQVLSGQYLKPTLFEPQRDSNEKLFGPDNLPLEATIRLVSNDPLPRKRMVRSYARRIVQDQNDLLGDPEQDRDFPRYTVLRQYTQWQALHATDAFGTEDFSPVPTIDLNDPPSMSKDTTTNETKLEAFISNHDLLAADPERRIAFVLGGLVGRLTAYQDRDETSSTMVRRYPVDSLTKRNFARITGEVLSVNHDYADADDNAPGLMYQRYQRRLQGLNNTDPTDWGISVDDLRLHYALGIAYGYEDTSISNDEDSND